MIEITFDIDKDFYQRMKKLSGGLDDTALLHLVFQIAELILEGVNRRSIYREVNGETQCDEIIDFFDLLEQYGMDETQKYIKDAKPEDFASG